MLILHLRLLLIKIIIIIIIISSSWLLSILSLGIIIRILRGNTIDRNVSSSEGGINRCCGLVTLEDGFVDENGAADDEPGDGRADADESHSDVALLGFGEPEGEGGVAGDLLDSDEGVFRIHEQDRNRRRAIARGRLRVRRKRIEAARLAEWTRNASSHVIDVELRARQRAVACDGAISAVARRRVATVTPATAIVATRILILTNRLTGFATVDLRARTCERDLLWGLLAGRLEGEVDGVRGEGRAAARGGGSEGDGCGLGVGEIDARLSAERIRHAGDGDALGGAVGERARELGR